MKRKTLISNMALFGWLMLSLWIGITVLNNYGEYIGSLFPAYLLFWSGGIFLGRVLIEWIIVFFFWS